MMDKWDLQNVNSLGFKTTQALNPTITVPLI